MTTKRPPIYLTARYSRGPELAKHRDVLVGLGFTVTSRWLDGDHQVSDEDLKSLDKMAKTHREAGEKSTPAVSVSSILDSPEGTVLQQRFAQEDWDDLMRATVVITFTEPPRSTASRGGRHVEFGAAIAYQKRCMVVGPRENVFHCLPEIEVFETFEQCLAELI